MQTPDNRAWLLAAPAFLVLAFVGAIPLAINTWHSFFDIFTLENKFWVGGEWYREILTSPRFYQSLGRSLAFSAVVLCVQFPLGIFIALCLPRSGWVRSLGLTLLAIPLLVPWNMIPSIWLSLVNAETGFLGRLLVWAAVDFNQAGDNSSLCSTRLQTMSRAVSRFIRPMFSTRWYNWGLS